MGWSGVRRASRFREPDTGLEIGSRGVTTAILDCFKAVRQAFKWFNQPRGRFGSQPDLADVLAVGPRRLVPHQSVAVQQREDGQVQQSHRLAVPAGTRRSSA